MAYSEVPADLEVTKWESDYWMEYVRMSGFKPYMSASVNAIIMTNRELIDGGKDIVLPLVGSLKGKGTGAGLLTGKEEKLASFPYRSRPIWRRNAVTVKKSTKTKAAIDVLKANKDSLKIWSSDDMREGIIDALSAVAIDETRYNEDDGIGLQVPYAEATPTQRNNWLSDNYDRVLFGNSQANTVAGNVASSLANVDLVNDKWSAAVLDEAKRMAHLRDRAAGKRAIRPYRSEGEDGREWFVLFIDTAGFNVLKNDPDIKEFNKHAREKSAASNPYFQGGDLEWNGIIIHEVPDMVTTLVDAGASSADLSVGYLCGAQALVVPWGQDPKSTKRTDDDYGFITGVGTEELRAIDKTFFKNDGAVGPGTQHGVVTIFAAVAA